MKEEGEFIDGSNIRGINDGVLFYVTEKTNLFLDTLL
jgi:hypothetical protein